MSGQSFVAIRRLSLVLIPLLHASPATPQSVDVVLTGRVSDTTGRHIAGAIVTATNIATRVAHSAISAEDGAYTIFNLPPSTYDLRAEQHGFAADVRRQRRLHVGTTITIDFVLAPASVVERVVVSSTLPLLETNTHTLARIVQRDEIDALPAFNRSVNDLAALAPGVTRTGVYDGVDISGNRDYQNAILVDGVSEERQRLGDLRMPYPQDWIQEFQVMTSQFAPEFGLASGGTLNVITRSGGQQIGGRAYAFLRHGAWDATPEFATRKPPLDEYRLGATLGGPIVRERAFYFAGIERYRHESNAIVNSTFAEANGTFPSLDTQTLMLAKLDVMASPSHTIRVRYSGQRAETNGAAIGGINTQEHGRYSKTRVNDVAAAWTAILTPSAVNELRAAWSTSMPRGGCNFARDHPAGTWFERAYPGALFGCPVNFGTIAENQFQIVQNLSWTRGRHTMKLGGQAAWTRSFGDFRNLRDGRYSFERDLPFALDDPRTYPFSFSLIDGPTEWDASGWAGGVFIQDRWALTDRLTTNVGVRYDLDGSLTALNPLVRTDRGLPTRALDRNNIAPRAGIAWTPFADRKTLLRGGVGLYYDQHHNNVATALLLNNILVDRVIVINANNALLNPFWPDIAAAKRFLAEALARNTTPDISTIPGLVGATNDIDRDLQIPSTIQGGGGVARELRPWLNVSADLVLARGRDLFVIRDVNIDPVTLRRINTRYSAISSFGNGGWNRYRALQLQLNAMPGNGRLLKAAYTLARNRSNTASTLSTGQATNPFDYREDEGPTDNDVRHTLAISGVTMIPFDVQISGIASYRSALPYSATTNAPRPDGKPFGYRPEPRNQRRGDDALSIDLRVTKAVPLGGPRRWASVFVEVFNITNSVSYNDYITTITSTRFGEPTTAGPKRRTQIGMRLDF